MSQKHLLFRFTVVALLIFGGTQASAFKLSEQARITLITCAPGNSAATVYGHSAIRVIDPAYNYDVAFNYGIYDFDAPNFLYRFASGQTDYLLAAYKFEAFVNSYKRERRSVYEQDLNLSQEEKQKIVDFLAWNAKPENRVYRYNFFYDNCATRVRDVFVDYVKGGIEFPEEGEQKTFRQLVKYYHGKLIWLDFGIDMVISSESDTLAKVWDEMFLPDYLMAHFDNAVRKSDGKRLVLNTRTLYEAPVVPGKSLLYLSPLVIFLLLTVVVLIKSVKEYRRGGMKNGFSLLVYGITGFMGIVIGWFVLYSEHPAMRPNYNLLWALPLNLVFVILWRIKKLREKLSAYHYFLAVWMLLFLATAWFIPQCFHPVFYLIVIIVLSRALPTAWLMLQKKRK